MSTEAYLPSARPGPLEQGPHNRAETSAPAKACLSIRVRLEMAGDMRDLALMQRRVPVAESVL